jgi:hypothetical protein
MDKQKDQHPPAPLPVEPGHVMSPEAYKRLVEAQQKQK